MLNVFSLKAKIELSFQIVKRSPRPGSFRFVHLQNKHHHLHTRPIISEVIGSKIQLRRGFLSI